MDDNTNNRRSTANSQAKTPQTQQLPLQQNLPLQDLEHAANDELQIPHEEEEDAQNQSQLQEYEEEDVADNISPNNNVLHNPLGEEIRLSAQSIKKFQNEDQLQKQMGVDARNSNNQYKNQPTEQQVLRNLNQEKTPSLQFGRSRQKNSNNIFGRARSGSKSRDSFKSDNQENQSAKKKSKAERMEQEFEKKCQRLLKVEDWAALDQIASQHLEDTKGSSYKGFFYLGVSFYKSGDFENAVRAFQKAEEINSEDAQLQYNLGLANFKLEQYNQAVDNFKKCTKLEPQHPFAYNNLAFLYNMHQFYSETIQVCGCAKMNNPNNHNCHRHWAFALFKKGEMAKAIKKIKKGIQKNPTDADNWIIWGLILRTVGNYASARHKFKKALKIDKDNETARLELLTVEKIIELDSQIPLEAVPSLRKNIQKKALDGGNSAQNEGCARSCDSDKICLTF